MQKLTMDRDLQRKLKMFNHVTAGAIFLCSLAIATPLSMFIGGGAFIAVLLFYKGE